MQLDLNSQSFTLDGVRKLLASKEDSADCQLRVTNDGIAYLSDIVDATGKEALRFRLESWDQGNNYVGQAASEDDEWVARIYKCLKKTGRYQPHRTLINSDINTLQDDQAEAVKVYRLKPSAQPNALFSK
jgi:hypothetical protein